MNSNSRYGIFSKTGSLLTLKEVSARLRIGRVTALRLLWDRTLRGFKVRRAWRIPKWDLEDYIWRQHQFPKKKTRVRRRARATARR